ncbi:hypothetical protein [Christiangramia crocea]|uniref:Uncharacterized protein n=1 Tax=Christiangramia crocea TaxID=2904124 RepID=A0A9X2A903_9FLAO|nr:hypothetical protein [Gramella crocea]MCG9973007.1 hypothetical protein [Gramella crocea]
MLSVSAAVCVLGFLGLSIGNNSNYANLYSDIFNSKFLLYKNEVESRYNILKNTESKEVELPPIKNYPSSFRNFEIKSDPGEWENSCFTKMINEMYDKQIHSIRLSKNQED